VEANKHAWGDSEMPRYQRPLLAIDLMIVLLLALYDVLPVHVRLAVYFVMLGGRITASVFRQ
jgi:hypothetical protein